MCQLLGVSSNKKVDVQFSLKEFRERGRSNPHGFGFVFYENGNPKLIKKPSSFQEEDIEKEDYKFKSKIIIGHVRFATCGGPNHKNTHPFVKDNWSFAHNGTVIEIKYRPLNKFKPEGETDSEYAFCYLLDRIHDKNDIKEIIKILEKEASEIIKLGNKKVKFNFLLSDGNYLFAYGHTSLYFVKRESPFPTVTLKYSKYKLNLNEIKSPDEKAIIIATEPLTKEENWQKFEGLKLFKDGEEIKINNV